MSFDAFGARRKTNWAGELTQAETDTLLSEIGIGTSRGYTGHEHLDRTGLIHMNGRVYDPTLGRFLSADPIVQAPYFSQSYNRYTYVWNNPLGMNDPSGYEGNDSLGEDDKEAPEPEPEKKREKPKPGVHRLHAGNGYSIVYGDGSSDDGESEGARSDQEESEEPEEGELTTELIRGDSNSSEILEEGVLGQEGMTAEEYLAAVENGLWEEAPVIEGFANNSEVNAAAGRVNSASSSSSGDVVADPRYIAVMKTISRATARASLAKGVGDAEKFLALSLDSSGNAVVSRIGILTGQGGNISSFISGAGAIAHVHYKGLLQPPVGGDHSAVKFRGISSFVIGYRGRRVWEVGRIGGDYKTRSISGSNPGKWRNY